MRNLDKKKPNLAICAIARLENAYINEWVEWHLKLGVDHIYVYDNKFGCEDSIDTVLLDRFRDKVTIIECFNRKAFQYNAY